MEQYVSMADQDPNFQIFTEIQDYHRLGEASDMSVDSHQTSNGGSMYSSVGSNNNSRTILMHPDLRTRTRTPFEGHSAVHRNSVPHHQGNDALCRALLDDRYPAEGLEQYEEWTTQAIHILGSVAQVSHQFLNASTKPMQSLCESFILHV